MHVAEIIAYSEAAVLNNAAVVEYCKISMAALSGGTAGLLGLTGVYGFGFYLFAVFGLWVRLVDGNLATIEHDITMVFAGNATDESRWSMEKIFY